jgi:hypothetical protein
MLKKVALNSIKNIQILSKRLVVGYHENVIDHY